MIPQSCRYKGVKYECGLSISCVLGGGRPLDLCSGGMIWACCVDRDIHTPTHHPDYGVLNNASKYAIFFSSITKKNGFVINSIAQ